MDPVRVGIIGCGVIGTRHLQAAMESPLLHIAAVADVRPEVAQAAGEHFGAQRVYTDGAALLADDRVEAVVLAMPANIRTELALQAFAAGKHVLTEKPVARSAAEVRRLIAAQGQLIGACCSSRMRCAPSAAVAAEVLAQGLLGELRVLFCRAMKAAGHPPTSPPPSWRVSKVENGGGILMNWGSYDLDYLLGLTGWRVRPQLALAQTWSVPPLLSMHVAPESDAETHVAALVMCADGVVLSYERGEFVAQASEESWRIEGSEGALRLQMPPGKGKQVLFDRVTRAQGAVTEVIWQGDEEWSLLHAGPINDFARAIREHRPPRTSLEHALIIQATSDAIYASAATSQPAPINV